MSSPFTPLGIYSSHDMRIKMDFQVKVEYGGKRFATFLLENVSYDGLVSTEADKGQYRNIYKIRKNIFKSEKIFLKSEKVF